MQRTDRPTPAEAAGIFSTETDPHAFVAGRMPLFAAVWLTSALTWSIVLAVGGVALAPIAVARAAEVAVLVAMAVGVRAAQGERLALRVAAGRGQA